MLITDRNNQKRNISFFESLYKQVNIVLLQIY